MSSSRKCWYNSISEASSAGRAEARELGSPSWKAVTKAPADEYEEVYGIQYREFRCKLFRTVQVRALQISGSLESKDCASLAPIPLSPFAPPVRAGVRCQVVVCFCIYVAIAGFVRWLFTCARSFAGWCGWMRRKCGRAFNPYPLARHVNYL